MTGRRRPPARRRHGDDHGGRRARDARRRARSPTRSWVAGYRHGEELLPAIEAAAGRARGRARGASAGSSSGPGRGVHGAPGRASRPRRALAHALGVPVAGVSTGEALLAAAAASTANVGRPPPAGRRRSDRVLDARRATRRASCPAASRARPRARRALVAVDLDGRAPGGRRRARRRRPAPGSRPRCSRAGAARLAARRGDDLARLVPEYVTLPRGVARRAGGRRRRLSGAARSPGRVA